MSGPGGTRPSPAPPSLRLARVHHPVTALGPGRRLGVWVQGCALACPGCMARDTWDPSAGWSARVSDVVQAWRHARADGAVGVTISGGEPTAQDAGLSALVDAVRADATPAPPGTAPEVDVLVFTGVADDGFEQAAPGLAARADAVVTGRFDITRPTDLIWRGSANQRLRPLTPLGQARYAPYVQRSVARPPMQILVTDDQVTTVGVPRIGDLPALERGLRERGLILQGVSWRP